MSGCPQTPLSICTGHERSHQEEGVNATNLKRKDSGICQRCVRSVKGTPFSFCARCREYQKIRMAKERNTLRYNGLCIYCHVEPSRGPRSSCATCHPGQLGRLNEDKDSYIYMCQECGTFRPDIKQQCLICKKRIREFETHCRHPFCARCGRVRVMKYPVEIFCVKCKRKVVKHNV